MVDNGATGDETGEAGPGSRSRSRSTRRRRNSLLWGLVGALSFLVLIQGYELVAGDPVGLGAKFGVAAVVGFAAAATTRTLAARMPAENESS